MKKTTLIVAMLLLGATAFATEKDKPEKSEKKVAVINNNPQKFKLVYLDKVQGTVAVALKNESGQVVHYSKVDNKEGFAQPYDLSDLPAGDYTFEVTDTEGKQLKKTVSLEKPNTKANFVANILNVNDGKKFRLAVVNKDKNAMPTSIKIYDENHNLLHSETVENYYAFRKIFDLSELPGDYFQFAVSNATGTKYVLAE